MPARKRSTELSRTEVCARYMQEAITPARMAEVRKKGTVIGICRSFATVKLKNRKPDIDG